MRNSRRYDLSERLIHFFRKLDLDDGSAPHIPEDWGEHNISDDTVLSALFLMRSAIRHGRLWATWSVRGGARTVYGPRPAVCFTDMPTAAFLEASAARLKAGQKISTYALTFPKAQLFDLGARPVIYGLSGSTADIPAGKGGGPRLIPAELLPLSEQFRYVSYYPTGRYQIDWTHEREWRWPYPGNLAEFDQQIETYGCVSEVSDIPGLEFYDAGVRGIGVIVPTRDDASKILHDVLSLIDRQVITPDTFDYILVADEIVTPAAIRDPDEEEKALAAAMIDLSGYLTSDPGDETIAQGVVAIVETVEAASGEPAWSELGGCWLWLVDNAHPVTRALLRTERVVVNNAGKYLMWLDGFSDSRSLRQREEMTRRVAAEVNREFKLPAGYFSVLMPDDPNGVPSYNSDFSDNRLIYNYGLDGV